MCRSVIEEKNQQVARAAVAGNSDRRTLVRASLRRADDPGSAVSRGDPALVAASCFALHADRTSGGRSERSRGCFRFGKLHPGAPRRFTPPGEFTTLLAPRAGARSDSALPRVAAAMATRDSTVYRLLNGFALVSINHDPESLAERVGDKARVRTVSAPLPPSSALGRPETVDSRLIGPRTDR